MNDFYDEDIKSNKILQETFQMMSESLSHIMTFHSKCSMKFYYAIWKK